MRRPCFLLRPFALACLACALAACGSEGEGAEAGPVVARVEGHPIALAELETAYARFAGLAGVQTADARVVHEVLDGLVMRRLVVQAALDDGLAETDAYREEQARVEKRALVDAYTHLVLLDTLAITEQDLARLFVQTQTTYEARHLYARTEPAARQLLARLDRGETFEALAREVFADPALAETGGYLGEFGHDEMDPAFEQALFEMRPGEVRGPVRTAQGYSIVKLEAKASNPMLTQTMFDERRSKLAQYERRRRETAARYAAAEHFLNEADPAFDAAGFAALAARWSGEGALTPLRPEAASARPVVRFQQNGRPVAWTAADLDALAAQADPAQRAAIETADDAERFVKGLIVREAMADVARRRGFDSRPEALRYVEREMEDWAFERAAAEARSGPPPTDAELRAHYDADPAAYRHGPRVEVDEVLVETKAEADRVLAALRRGADFGRLAAEESIRPGAALTGGALGPVAKDELGWLGDAIFSAAPGALLGPFEVAGRYVVLRRGADVDRAPMTFDEARPRVAEAVRRDLAAARFREQIDALRGRYAVEVDSGVLARAQLTATPVMPGTPRIPLPL